MVALFTLGVFAYVAAAGARASSTDDTSEKTPSTTKSQQQHKTSTTSASAKKSTGKTHTASTKHSSKKKHPRGQQKIDSERAQAIQEALIREHYMTGEATGAWNQSSEEAMRRYQADHGWQSKTVPDSRALISLGLGPSKDHLLNPESAMTTVPDSPRAEPIPTTSHSGAPTTSTAPAAAAQTDSPSPH